MKKLLIIIFLCSLILFFNSCNIIGEGIKINKNIEEQDLYVFTQYKFKLFASSIKYGYMNSNGDVIIEPYFDYAEDFIDGFAKVEVESGYGILSSTGEYFLEPDFSDCEYLGNHIICELPLEHPLN